MESRNRCPWSVDNTYAMQNRSKQTDSFTKNMVVVVVIIVVRTPYIGSDGRGD
jgi:hypothetical protein